MSISVPSEIPLIVGRDITGMSALPRDGGVEGLEGLAGRVEVGILP